MEEGSIPNRVRERLRGWRTRWTIARRYPRRFHAFCVGTEKSGTHSIHALFAPRFRSDHEPDYPRLIARIVRNAGRKQEVAAGDAGWLRRRDRRLWLEMEACWLHVFHLRALAATFPEAKFVLTIRDCYSWLDSLANHVVMREIGRSWRRAQEVYYRPGAFQHQPGEEVFVRAGLYPIRAYLTGWAWHNRAVLEAVPPERLLVVRTRDIKRSGDELARFVDVPPSAIAAAAGHQYSNTQKQHLLRRIDRALLEGTVAACCGDVMGRWFPEIRSLDDALPPVAGRPAVRAGA